MMTADEYEEKGLLYLDIAYRMRKLENKQKEMVCLPRDEYNRLIAIEQDYILKKSKK